MESVTTCLALYTSSLPQLRDSERVGDLSRVTEQKPKRAKPKPTRFQGLRAYVLRKQGLLMLEDKGLRCQGRNKCWQRKEPAQSLEGLKLDVSRAPRPQTQNSCSIPRRGSSHCSGGPCPIYPRNTHTQVPAIQRAESVQDLGLSEDSHISHGLACVSRLITLS